MGLRGYWGGFAKSAVSADNDCASTGPSISLELQDASLRSMFYRQVNKENKFLQVLCGQLNELINQQNNPTYRRVLRMDLVAFVDSGNLI